MPLTQVSTTQVIWTSQGGALLRIDVTDDQKSDPLADWKTKAAQRKASGCYADYQEISIESVDNFYLSAADWAFMFTTNGTREHVRIRGVVTSAKRAYGIWWSVPDSQWSQTVAELDLILRNFRRGAEPLPSYRTFAKYRPPCS